MHIKLADYLKDNSTIITPSRRLAGSLLTQANGYYAQTKRVWPTPAIFALSDWLLAIWQQLEIQGVLQKQLLEPSQSLLVWTAIIRANAISKKLLNVSVTAKMAAAAWGLLQQWQVQDSWDEHPLTLDQETFQSFAKAYEKWLVKHDALDSNELASAIRPFFAPDYQSAWQRLSPVKTVVFYGFEEFSPMIEQLIGTLKEQQWQVDFIEPVKKVPTLVGRKAYHDLEQEFLAAANFAKKRLEMGKKNIGIVVPDLANQRSLVDKTFKEVFQPLAITDPKAKVCDHYNISAAVPLDHYPIIHSAFALLKMVGGTFTLNEYFLTINAPFFAWGETELTTILQHYEHLKENHKKTLLLTQVNKTLHEPVLRDIILQLVNVAALPKKMPYAEWAKHFQHLLTLAGWPGKRSLNSVEHQAVARWGEALAQLRLADSALGPASYKEALSILRGIVSQIPFQAQSKGASVQVLGVLEALGLQFDCLWVVGLHSEAWPPLAKPNPFIPLPLQRQLKMPHASSEREMEYAKTMTDRLVSSADEIILSYPKKEKAKTLDFSELIRHIPELPQDWELDVVTAERLENRLAKPQLEKIATTETIPLQVTEKIPATSHLLTLQAACPFKAFAELRLQAKRIRAEDDWLAPHQQGTILHEVLQHFWQQMSTQEALLATSETRLTGILEALIEKALNKHIKANTPLPYLHVEKSRLLMIVSDYLNIEKLRNPFQVVATECTRSLTMHDMQFHVRLDRIDKTDNDEMIVIDYKSGQFSINDIWSDRPKAPQLPLYYLATFADDPQGLLVAKLNRQHLAYEGIANQALGIEGVVPPKFLDWQELKAYWTTTLGNLVAAFKSGETTVDPLDTNTTCRHCDLGPFCRINEREVDDH